MTVLNLQPRYRRKAEPSNSRPEAPDMLSNVIALLTRVEGQAIQTSEDVRQAIFMLDLANMCIRIVVSSIESGTAKGNLLAQCARIDQLIEVARKEAVHIF
jgi:hypothetical protein